MTARLENLEEVIPKSLISKTRYIICFLKMKKVNYVLIEIELLRLNTFKSLKILNLKVMKLKLKRKYI